MLLKNCNIERHDRTSFPVFSANAKAAVKSVLTFSRRAIAKSLQETDRNIMQIVM